jgi:hypothetical protein
MTGRINLVGEGTQTWQEKAPIVTVIIKPESPTDAMAIYLGLSATPDVEGEDA